MHKRIFHLHWDSTFFSNFAGSILKLYIHHGYSDQAQQIVQFKQQRGTFSLFTLVCLKHLVKYIIYNYILDTFRHHETDKCMQRCYYLKQNQRCKAAFLSAQPYFLWCLSCFYDPQPQFYSNLGSHKSLKIELRFLAPFSLQ